MPDAAATLVSPAEPALIGTLLRVPWQAVHERMLAAAHAVGFTDLVAPHLTVLGCSGPRDLRPSDIAARAHMTKQALNYLLGQMEALGYVERHDDPGDLRAKHVWLTPRGEQVVQVMREEAARVEAEWE